jgi:peptidoglycan/LPS O-acetylase OafA/YrhL
MLVLDEVLLLTGFTLVVQGADIFGFLASRPVRLLGRISYPVYLVHGLVYYVAMKLRGGTYAVEIYSYSVETAVCLAVILLLATMIHLSIEQPSIKLSESFARRAWSSN